MTTPKCAPDFHTNIFLNPLSIYFYKNYDKFGGKAILRNSFNNRMGFLQGKNYIKVRPQDDLDNYLN